MPEPVESELELRGTTYRLAVLGGSELAPLLPLFRDAFGGREFDLDVLRRKYSCEHGGLAGFAYVAFAESGEAAGSVGLLPWPARYGAWVETAGQLVDVATATAHRGRGLFVALADKARELCEAAGVGFLFGFPNADAYPIWINKLGFEHVDDLLEYRLPVRTLWAERLARRTGALARIHEGYVRRASRTYAPKEPVLENSLLGEGFAGIERNRAFHAYKASFDGARVLDLDGGRVWLKVRNGLFVGDLEAASPEDLDRSARALVRLSRRLGIHQIVFQASKDTRFTRFCSHRFQTSSTLPVIYRSLDSKIPKEKLRFTFGDLDNF